jgi:hypothetical protein
LATKPVEEYLARFGFRSELLLAMYAVTDGFSGLSASFGMPGTGLNFLVDNNGVKGMRLATSDLGRQCGIQGNVAGVSDPALAALF